MKHAFIYRILALFKEKREPEESAILVQFLKAEGKKIDEVTKDSIAYRIFRINILLKLALDIDHLFISSPLLSKSGKTLSALRARNLFVRDKSRGRDIYSVQRTSEKGESPVVAARRRSVPPFSKHGGTEAS